MSIRFLVSLFWRSFIVQRLHSIAGDPIYWNRSDVVNEVNLFEQCVYIYVWIRVFPFTFHKGLSIFSARMGDIFTNVFGILATALDFIYSSTVFCCVSCTREGGGM